ncbi:MAG: c-type cytochrome [Labilithrix sp.]|nr:c-type cytochrome [Labilithrix sp.]
MVRRDANRPASSRRLGASVLASFVLSAAAAGAAGCDKKGPAPPEPSEAPGVANGGSGASASPAPAASTALPAFDPALLNLFAPIPEAVEKPVVDETIKLGRMLFFDARLSRGHDVSCASCHDLGRAGQDGEPTAKGAKEARSKRNTATVLNAGGSFAQGWDARAASVEDFVGPHLLDPVIMGPGAEAHLAEVVLSIPAYAAAFKKAFPDDKPAVSSETIARAIGGYTTKLFARSRWDRYLGGETAALDAAELRGFAMFVEAGCTSCHQGKFLGGTQTQKLGIAKAWPPPAGTDLGRFEVTKQDVDRGMWKVPTLRNVTRTGPWLHDGSISSIEEVTRLMARHQVGRELGDPQVAAIVAWLRTLEGDAPTELTTKPALPPSGPKTPRAE